MVLYQLLPVCHHDFDYPHEALGHLHALIKVFEELLHLLDTDASLFDLNEDVNGPGLTIISLDNDVFRLVVVEIKCSHMLRRVLLHDLILPFHCFFLNNLYLIQRLA